MTTNFIVLDRNGKRVQRNGVLQNGDRLTVPISLMDGGQRGALSLLDANSPPTRDQLQSLRDERDRRLENAWRNDAAREAPTPSADMSRDQARAERNRRISDMWKH
ncbi:hypothetical protein XI06_13190 [Bradyrhizobium sp. CCBAU 11434]|uniref:hypothetical protein n=1 Tax=Bradyrhizobium sp. CCBAU 11434 TaxID=1630885 RepID=UPI002304D245|nr:hypothetical protein [Bradyrhizobium sp. CCBAU 11434]MDA9521300.1 hypothetical protein [Bradyrhizobium sp. CCBAU 11434]